MKTSYNHAGKPLATSDTRYVVRAVALALVLAALLTTTSAPAQQEPQLVPAVATDLASYSPGDTALVFGGGFQPGETVMLQLVHEDGLPATGPNDGPWQVVADGDGRLSGCLIVCQEDCHGTAVWLSAGGQSSGLTAQTRFVVRPLPSLPPSTFVFTDNSDYPPGGTAYITGRGFEVGETVVLQVLHADGQPSTGTDHEPWTVVADGNGALTAMWYVCEDDCLGATLRLSAVGQTSGRVALAFFTDGCPNLGGQLVQAFDAGSAPDNTVYTTALEPDGRVLIGGLFSRVHGVVCNKIARLNTDGSTDATFLNGLAGVSEASAVVYAVAVQPDGKVLVGGQFATVNGTTRRGLARLNSDGSIDSSFVDPGIQTGVGGPAGTVNSIVVQTDGKVLIGGTFTLINGVARTRIARLNTDGSLDSTFQTGMTGAANTVLSIALQPDGQILIGGIFTSVNGATRNRIARLNGDGSLDTTFQNGMTGANLSVNAVAVQPDGRVLIGGDFVSVNGVTRNRIARLNTDGSLDTAFQNGMTGANVVVNSVAVQSDGRVLLGGSFISVNGVARNRVARLNTDGSLDSTFLSGLSGIGAVTVTATVNSVLAQSDGQVLVGGQFESANELQRRRIARLNPDGSTEVTFQNGPGGPNDLVQCMGLQSDGKAIIGGSFTSLSAVRNRIARLNTDGSLDITFQNGMIGANSTVYGVAVQADGKVLVVGQFTLVNGTSRLRLARLNTDGSLDPTFAPTANNIVLSLALQPDGKILIGGLFTTVNGTSRTTLARLNTDGTLDTTFSPFGLNGQIESIVVQLDGRVLIGGTFSTVNGVTRNRIAQLNADGSLDTTFQNGMSGVNGIVYSVALQSDGRVLLGGSINSINGVTRNGIGRLNTDGSLDTTFLNGMPGANLAVYAVALEPDGKVVIGGLFTTMNGVARNHIAQLNLNGSLDTTFQNTLSGANDYVQSVVIEPDGNVLVGGNFTTVNGVPREGVARLYGTTPDITPPTIICPADQIVSTAPGQCSAVVNYPTPTASDECLSVAVSCAPPSGSTFPKGTTTVNCTATDASGNTATCSFSVTVNDTENPPITCPANIVTSTDAGQCSAALNPSPATAVDDCPGVSVAGVRSDDQPLNAVYPKGLTTITWTATDAAGNSASCNQTVTVNDTENPTITCPANIATSTDPGQCSASLNPGTATAVDNCPGVSVAGVRSDGQPLNAPYSKGLTTITWTATDAAGYSASCNQTVTVNDTENPTITCPANIATSTALGQCSAALNPGTATAVDNCPSVSVAGVRSDGQPLNAVYPKGLTTITWTATDAAGNSASCNQTVTVNDTENPTITCPANIATSTDPGQCSAAHNPGTATAVDNCPGVSVAGVRSDGQPLNAVYPKGLTTITWTATDAAGNSASCNQTVTVNDTELPTITCPGNITVSTGPGVVNYPVPTTTDNCGIASVVCVPPSGSVFTAGTTTVDCSATDTSGNTVQCSFSVTVGAPASVVCDPAGDAISGGGKGGSAVPLWLDITRATIIDSGDSIRFTLTLNAPIPTVPVWSGAGGGGQFWWGWRLVGDAANLTYVANGCHLGKGKTVPAEYLLDLIWSVQTSSFRARLLDDTSCTESVIPMALSPDRTQVDLVVTKASFANATLIPNPNTFQYFATTLVWKANTSFVDVDDAPNGNANGSVWGTWSSTTTTTYGCP